MRNTDVVLFIVTRRGQTMYVQVSDPIQPASRKGGADGLERIPSGTPMPSSRYSSHAKRYRRGSYFGVSSQCIGRHDRESDATCGGYWAAWRAALPITDTTVQIDRTKATRPGGRRRNEAVGSMYRLAGVHEPLS
jgi:hypothetical protein